MRQPLLFRPLIIDLKIGFIVATNSMQVPPWNEATPLNQDILIGPKGGRIRGSSLYVKPCPLKKCFDLEI